MVVRIFIEGTTDDDNGDLSQGFRLLFEQKLKGKMPKILMGDGKDSTIDMFKHTVYKNNEQEDRFLLIDLDHPSQAKETDIKENDLDNNRCFYMIQEMESWFISQPNVLQERYGTELLTRIPKRNASEIENPDEKLNEWLRPLGRRYHKVKDGVKMLKMLNLDKLMQDFPDVKNLVEELQKA